MYVRILAGGAMACMLAIAASAQPRQTGSGGRASAPVSRIVPCCSVVSLDAATRHGAARDRATGSIITFEARSPQQFATLRIGTMLAADYRTHTLSLPLPDIAPCCNIVSIATHDPVAVPRGTSAPSGATPGMIRVAVAGAPITGVPSPDRENTRGEHDPVVKPVPSAVSFLPMKGGGMRLRDNENAERIIKLANDIMHGVDIHFALLGGHKYMVNNCLGMKASVGTFDMRIPLPDTRIEGTGIVVTFDVERIQLNALTVRFSPNPGDITNACGFGGKVNIGGYAEHVKYALRFDPVLDVQQCRIGQVGLIREEWSIDKIRLEPLPPEIGDLARDMIVDALRGGSGFAVQTVFDSFEKAVKQGLGCQV